MESEELRSLDVQRDEQKLMKLNQSSWLHLYIGITMKINLLNFGSFLFLLYLKIILKKLKLLNPNTQIEIFSTISSNFQR